MEEWLTMINGMKAGEILSTCLLKMSKRLSAQSSVEQSSRMLKLGYAQFQTLLLVDLAGLHDEVDLGHEGDVGEGVAGDGDEVGDLA